MDRRREENRSAGDSTSRAKEPGAAAQNAEHSAAEGGRSLPDYQLMDSKGRQITRETFAGKPLLITFIFTRCPIPNFCPLMTNNFREIQQALVASPDQANRVQLLSISFDSEFDTPEVLSAIRRAHTKDTDQWRFATGTPQETGRLTQAFAIAVQPGERHHQPRSRDRTRRWPMA